MFGTIIHLIIDVIAIVLLVKCYQLRQQRNKARDWAAQKAEDIERQNESMKKMIRSSALVRKTNRRLRKNLLEAHADLRASHQNLERVLLANMPTGTFDDIGVEVGRHGLHYVFTKKELSPN